MISKKLITDKFSLIESILKAKYPNVIISTESYFTDRTKYDSTGNRPLYNYFTETRLYKIINDVSSHKNLKNPYVTMGITISITSESILVNLDIKTDQVDVNYMTNPKESKKNVTIARSQYASFRKWIYGTKKFASVINTISLDRETSNIVSTEIETVKQTKNFRSEVFHKISPLIRSLGMNKTNSIYNIKRVGRTFYDGDIKIGQKDDVVGYVLQNPNRFVHNFTDKYPLLVKQ
jgi:hypothetical protein